jgi:hypothetical protein
MKTFEIGAVAYIQMKMVKLNIFQDEIHQILGKFGPLSPLPLQSAPSPNLRKVFGCVFKL